MLEFIYAKELPLNKKDKIILYMHKNKSNKYRIWLYPQGQTEEN